MLIILIAGIFDRLFKRKKEPEEDVGVIELEQMPEYGAEGGYAYQTEEPPAYFNEPSELTMKSQIFYDFNKMEYRLKLQNISIDMLGDLTIKLKSQKNPVATPIDNEKVIEMLEPGKSVILKFRLKPKYKTGKSSIFGTMEYFDFKSKERKIVRLPPSQIDFELDEISMKRVNDDQWRVTCGGLKSYELETDVLDIQPDKLFNMFKRVLENEGLFLLPPIENVNLYRGIAKAFGVTKSGVIFTVEAQVIGDQKSAKVLFRIWSNEAKDAMALAYRTLDTIEAIFQIKKFIVET